MTDLLELERRQISAGINGGADRERDRFVGFAKGEAKSNQIIREVSCGLVPSARCRTHVRCVDGNPWNQIGEDGQSVDDRVGGIE